MGGDGGVIASNRKYMRGAGTADHTGDLNRHAAQKFSPQEVMSTCALTKTSFNLSSNRNRKIVADPYGSLYFKEAAVEALLKRKQNKDTGDSNAKTNAIGPQVRRLNDLYEVRFHRDEGRNVENIVCPISGKALTGSIPAILLVPGQDGLPNVVSESALSQISPEELESEHGKIRRRVRLAPDPILLGKIKERVQQEHEKDNEERRKAKKDKTKEKKKKRKRDSEDKKNAQDGNKKRSIEPEKDEKLSRRRDHVKTKSSKLSFGKEVRSRVDSAIQQNSVLSSIFTNKSASSKITDKEKKDNLFAR